MLEKFWYLLRKSVPFRYIKNSTKKNSGKTAFITITPYKEELLASLKKKGARQNRAEEVKKDIGKIDKKMKLTIKQGRGDDAKTRNDAGRK